MEAALLSRAAGAGDPAYLPSTSSTSHAADVAYEHYRAGRLVTCASSCRQALARDPADAGVMNLLGVVLAGSGDVAAGLSWLERAVAAAPGAADYHSNLATWLARAGRAPEAIAHLRAAVRLRPNFADAYRNLGLALLQARQVDEAVTALRAAWHPRRTDAETGRDLAALCLQTGRQDEAIEVLRHLVELSPTDADVHRELLLATPLPESAAPADLCREARRWARQHAAKIRGSGVTNIRDRSPDRPLRVGYVSADFCDHPIGRRAALLLEAHDRSAIVPICYADVTREDKISQRLRAAAREWHDVRELDDARWAARICADRIDVLIDLGGHASSRPRLLGFARRPAPVQITFSEYPGTSGLTGAFDARLTDAFRDPPGDADQSYTEPLLRLDHCSRLYEPPYASCDLPLAPSPRQAGGPVIFGYLGRLTKVTAEALDCWADALAAVEGSRLRLLADGIEAQALPDRVARQGIDPARVDAVPPCSVGDYLRALGEIDVHLDPFPCSAPTAALDAMWMGVPAVMLAGHPTAAIARAAGLQEFIAPDRAEYVRLAVAWARDTRLLIAARGELRRRLTESPLRGGAGLARSVERAYRDLWRAWCSAEPAGRARRT